MALELLERHWNTDVLDIHAGGVDLIFPHHEDEIAQSCAYTGRAEFARHWVHGEFLRIDGTKMSKRYGNILTVRDLREQAVEPGAVRLLLFGTHYRQLLEWSDEALAAAREGSARLGAFRDRLERAAGDADAPRSRPWPTVSGWTSPPRWTTTSTRPARSPRSSSWFGRATGCWMGV